LSLAGSGSASADTGPNVGPTQGSSSALSLQVTPHEGSLAVGALFGVALAGNTDTFAKAQSEGLDLGAVGESMKSYNCGSPPNQFVYNAVPDPLIVESGQPGASQGITQGPSQQDYGANEYGRADNSPYGEADTTYVGPLQDPTNAVVVSGMHSKAWSGVVNGVAESGATSDIGSLSLGGGTVVLDGLHWESVSPVGGGQPTGSFSIGKAVIAGNSVPTADLSTLSTAVNQALGTLGLVVGIPSPYESSGIQFVDPLQVEVVPNSTRDGITDPIITSQAVQGNYYQVASGLENGFSPNQPQPYNNLAPVEATQPGQQIAAALCQSDTPITVADITIASLDGGGYFNVALGGVNSTDGPLLTGNFCLACALPGSLGGGTSQFLPGTAALTGTLGTTGSSGPVPNGPGGAPGTTHLQRQAVHFIPSGYQPGGPMLGAGLGGLLLLLGLAEGDRRLMRRAQKAAAAATGGST
jgi:hypothetical protein